MTKLAGQSAVVVTKKGKEMTKI